MAPTLNIVFLLRKKKLTVVVKRSQGVSWAFSTPDKTPFYKNVLALELFVGRVFAYFQMFSLAEIPPQRIRNLLTTTDSCQRKSYI